MSKKVPVRTSKNPYMIPTVPFEQYAPKYNKLFNLSCTDDGIVMAKWCNTEDNTKSAMWDQPIHRAIGQLCFDVGQDVDAEVFILGGEGHDWLSTIHSTEKEDDEGRKWLSYEHMYYDGCNINDGLINAMHIPTIGVINGPGFHTEMAIMCDITLISDDAVICDPHYYPSKMVPGDGIQVAFQQAMGVKKANYAMWMCQKFTAEEAVAVGLANEVVPKDKIYDRAMEIAKQLLQAPRITRRATADLLRRPWKKAWTDEGRLGFGYEMWAYMAESISHDGGGGVQDQMMKDMGATQEAHDA